MADGRIWFDTKIDNKGIEKDLNELERKIKKSEEEEAPTTKMCPYCRSEDVPIEATRCPHCTSQLEEKAG